VNRAHGARWPALARCRRYRVATALLLLAGAALPLALDRIEKVAQSAVDVSRCDLLRRCGHKDAQWGGRDGAPVRKVSRSPPRARTSFRKRSGPPLRQTKGDVPATSVPHQAEGADSKVLYESNHVDHILGNREAMAHAVPGFWKEVPQTDRYDPNTGDHTRPLG